MKLVRPILNTEFEVVFFVETFWKVFGGHRIKRFAGV